MAVIVRRKTAWCLHLLAAARLLLIIDISCCTLVGSLAAFMSSPGPLHCCASGNIRSVEVDSAATMRALLFPAHLRSRPTV